MSRTPSHRNLDAEVRAVEEGHVARADSPGYLVTSDSRACKRYRVQFAMVHRGPVTFQCNPEGDHAYEGDHLAVCGQPGVVPCKHAAVVARRLERAGDILLDGMGCWLEAGRLPEPIIDLDALFGGSKI